LRYPENCIAALARKGIRDLTCISNMRVSMILVWASFEDKNRSEK